MKTNKLTISFSLSCLFAAGACSTNDTELDTAKSGLTAAVAHRLDTVAELSAQRGSGSALGDAPAELAFERMAAARSSGRSATELAVYQLAAPQPDVTSELAARSLELGLSWSAAQRQPGDEGNVMGGPFMRKDSTRVIGLFEGAPWALEYNRSSGAERFFDRDKFHVGLGAIVAPDMNAYVSRASQFLAQMRGTAASPLHVYKTRRYLNAIDSDTTPVEEEIYQIAVAFGSDIDGVPVIGPGGKVSVHLANGMQPVSYESTVMPVVQTRARLSAGSLLSPADAETEAWAKLIADGLGRTTHQLSSRQLGYLRRGRNSVQTLVAPTYAFFFEPLTEGAKRRIEVVSAVTDPTLRAQLDADEATERSRKHRDDQPDVR